MKAAGGDEDALRRVRAVAARPTLAAAELALAREHGYSSWARLGVGDLKDFYERHGYFGRNPMTKRLLPLPGRAREAPVRRLASGGPTEGPG